MLLVRIALAQIATTVADFSGNSRKILEGIERAKSAGAATVLFPELAITGYPPRDLLDRPSFIEIVDRISQEVARILAMPDVRERYAASGNEPVASTPAEFAAFIRREADRWTPVIKAAGIRLD